MKYFKIPENLNSAKSTMTYECMGRLLLALMDFGFGNTIVDEEFFCDKKTYAIYQMLINDERNWE